VTPPLRNADILGVPVAAVTIGGFLDILDAWVGEGTPRAVAYLNAHTSNMVASDAPFRERLLAMDMRYADGMSIVKASHRLGSPLPCRVNAGDFLHTFVWLASARHWRVAFVGSRPGIAQACASSLGNGLPYAVPAFVHHGHFAPNSQAEGRLIQQLEQLKPHVLLIGMGSPRQEQWALQARERGLATVSWCVGALFEYWAGRHRAPVAIRELGLEWAWRLALEPRRLAARYLFGNARFLWRLSRAANQ